VATGLAYLEDQIEQAGDANDSTSQKGSGRKDKTITSDEVRTYLAKQKKEHLVEIIMERLPWDEELQQKLSLRAARDGAGKPDIVAYRKAITAATRIGSNGFVDYRSAPSFARRIEAIVASIGELLETGQSTEVVGLAEYVLARCEKAMGEMDDSDGYMGSILQQVSEIHHAACLAAKSDPEDLARRLFKWELETQWDTFYGAAETYADVLGKKGLTIYRQLAQAMWKDLPALGPGDEQRSFDGNRFRLTSIMKSLALADGDTEELVAVMSKDLSSAYQFLEIAEVYRKASQRNKALEWAERGLKVFADSPDERLEDFVADEYHRRKRHEEAMALIWNQFERQPYLNGYVHLKKHAERTKQWPSWRDKALKLIHKHIGYATRQPRKKDLWLDSAPPDHSPLVEIYLWEKDVESAWQEAQIGGCSDQLWMELAKRRERDYPADAVAIYRKHVDWILGGTNKQAYREATKLLRKIQTLMSLMRQEGDFAEYLAKVRNQYKRKRNFIAMISSL